MPCACAAGLCTTCACGKKGALCTPACHGGRGLEGNACCLNFKEAVPIVALSIGEVRKALAASGLDVIGSQNELKRRLAEHVIATTGGGGASAAAAASAPGAAAAAAAAPSNTALIRQVLEAADDYTALLSLAGLPITGASPVPELRRAYLKLSLRIHPDKNSGSGEAKLAFQALVLALERLSQPGGGLGGSATGAGGGAGAPPAPRQRMDAAALVPRSNEGCVQHRVLCPRCGMDWPRKELGLEDAAYNFFMSALKEYTCGRCACTFGCMSATHQCPGCRRPFSYAPSDYHSRIGCGNEGCSKTFGFLQHPVSAKRWGEVRKELQVAQEERVLKAEARARRAARGAARAPPPAAPAAAAAAAPSGKKGGGSSSSSAAAGASSDAERLFLMELTDTCPRCGITLGQEGGGKAGGQGGGDDDDEEEEEEDGVAAAVTPAAHLAACTNARAHAAYAAVKAGREGVQQERERRALAAEAAIALATWVAGGRVAGGLWMLPREALLQLCREVGVSVAGSSSSSSSSSSSGAVSRVELVRRYCAFYRAGGAGARLALEDAKQAGAGGGGGGGKSGKGGAGAAAPSMDAAHISQLEAHELPRNLHALSSENLACLCVSFGLEAKEGEAGSVLLRRLERARFVGREEEAGLALLGDGEGGKRGRLGNKREEEEEEEEEDSEAEVEVEEEEEEGGGAGGGARKKKRKAGAR